MSADRQKLVAYRDKIHNELYESVVPFWLRHAPDREFGGTFNCLDRDGKVWDTRKHMWLQGRLVWMFSKLYNTVEQRDDYLEMARLGTEFLTQKAYRADSRVWFSLTREGLPIQMQRKIYTECFYVLALSEYGRATNDDRLRAEARRMLDVVVAFAHDASLVGRPAMPHLPAVSALAPPMIILNLLEEVREPDDTAYDVLGDWCVAEIDKHVIANQQLVLEHVGADGELLDSPEGRLINPGHAIECAWFLIEHARRRGDSERVQQALRMIDWSFDAGWDTEHGGLFYFLDREGYSPQQIEWNTKLWWPHCEAMVAFLMAYAESGDVSYWEKFERVTDYSFEHFSDPEYGEWYGYLDRYGDVTHRFKGASYKGFFHVPRALWMCDRLLTKMIDRGLE